MKKQIFRSVCVTAAVVLLAALALVTGVLYEYFSGRQMEGLDVRTDIAVAALEQGGIEYLEKISDGDFRITWVAPDGAVLFDNMTDSGKMENHLEREEIKTAMETGTGRSERYSATLTQRRLYSARRLGDGSVLRLSAVQLSWWVLLLGMLQPLILIAAAALGLSIFMAYSLADRIVRPLDELDLEQPNTTPVYSELEPLLNRLAHQKQQLQLRQNELKRKKEEFDTVTANLQEGLVLLGRGGSILSMNKAAADILKTDRSNTNLEPPGFDCGPETDELLQCAQSGQSAEKNITLGGRIYRFNANPITVDGDISGVALLIVDITEKERAETARREFTANVSHELKTPLQNISGCAELLANGMVRQEDIQSFAANIHAEAGRMISLVEDIIKLSRLDEGAGSQSFERTDLFVLARHVHERLLANARGRGVDFRLTGRSGQINGIPPLISEIIYNLCDNAIKYNHRGGRVELKVEDRADSAVLTVADTGIGIPPAEREHIFERFYRVDKSRSKAVGGTGLGLSIVKHAALVHNADIRVSGGREGGSTFIITFPKEAQT